MTARFAVPLALTLFAGAAPVAALMCPSVAEARAVTEVPQIGDEKITPVDQPYGAPEGADDAVADAFRKAKADQKPVLLDFGGNWCPDCRILGGIFAVPAVDSWLKANFEVVTVNVMKLDANMDIAARYGVKITAVPTVLIVTPEGKVLNADASTALGKARQMSSQAVINLIAGWAAR